MFVPTQRKSKVVLLRGHCMVSWSDEHNKDMYFSSSKVKRIKKVLEGLKCEIHNDVSHLVVLQEAKYPVFEDLRCAGVSLAKFHLVTEVCHCLGRVLGKWQ